MPPFEMVTNSFLKQILKVEKKLIKMRDLRACNSPRYDEISVKNLHYECNKMKEMQLFLPKEYLKGRKYFFNVLSTLRRFVITHLIKVYQSVARMFQVLEITLCIKSNLFIIL